MAGKRTRYVSYSVCAVRRESDHGWMIVQTTLKGRTLENALRGEALDPASLIEILGGSMRSDLARDVAVLPRDEAFRSVCGWGWAYDEATDQWCPPGELTTPPPADPINVDDLGVAFSLPDAGWIEIQIAASDQRAAFSASNVFDPFKPLVAWLEGVARGENGRLTIDVEGSEVEFNTWPLDDGWTRFAVASNWSDARDYLLDVAINRKTLAKTIYASLMSYWSSAEFIDRWRDWVFQTADPDDEDDAAYLSAPYTLASPELDRLLGKEALED